MRFEGPEKWVNPLRSSLWLGNRYVGVRCDLIKLGFEVWDYQTLGSDDHFWV